MAYVITDKCTRCGACKEVCPVEAISEGDPKFVIDADTCIDCGVCAISVFSDDKLNQLIEVDGKNEFIIYMAALGKKKLVK